MKLIVHMGLHKTGSTWLQHLLNRNSRVLGARGIHYQEQPGYPAHHQVAWAALAGNGQPLADMLASAREAGRHTVIFSSEDLEGVLFNPPVAALIEEVAANEGVDAIEWHLCLRAPGAYFSSLHAQLQHHVYADPLAMFREAMARGVIFIPEPLGAEGTPYWFYCFDAHPFVSGFAGRTQWPVVVHDYADADPFPGWRMIGGLGALDALILKPGEEGRNKRLPADAVVDGFVARVMETIEDEDSRAAVEPFARDAVLRGLEAVPLYAAALDKRFAQSHADTLAQFAPR